MAEEKNENEPKKIDDDLKEFISRDLQTQWQDHFHMRDQTWKVLQYSILFFLGVVGLEFNKDVKEVFLIPAYAAVLLTSFFGVRIAYHHRRRQKEKFKIIKIYEKQLGLYPLIKDIIDLPSMRSKCPDSNNLSLKKRILKKFRDFIEDPIRVSNTGTYIAAMQYAIFVVSAFLFLRVLFFPRN